MKYCSITGETIPESESYSRRALSLLSPKLTQLLPIPYSAEQQRREAIARATKMSIQGVQPKLSAKLNVRQGAFEIVDVGGTYILKPPHALYPALPENEALTMRLASTVGISVPLSGLVRAHDETFTYFTRRFDRYGRHKKRMQEDFAQLMGKTRDTKYDSSIEQVISVIEEYCTFPKIEKIKLFRVILFSFLTGNEDLHLKNFSLLAIDRKIELSPAYDLLNTTIALPHVEEESALPLKGKKRNLLRGDFLNYLAIERLDLLPAIVDEEVSILHSAVTTLWPQLIASSFLPSALKIEYLKVVEERAKRIF